MSDPGRSLGGMTGVGRSLEQINAEIRELWAAGPLSPECEARYRRLVVEYAAAVRAEQAAVRAEQQLAA